jgi:2-polyprenyl-6-methoxyphenol hydroxylase-like FAD-dependent oxidoreductase
MNQTADVVIAGGGIAGAAAAIVLGRMGLGVRVFEQRRPTSDKPCGEAIMPAGVAVLRRLGLLSSVGGATLLGVRYHAGKVSAEKRFPGEEVSAYGLGQRRRHLHRTLLDAAADTHGVEVHCGARVQGVAFTKDGRASGLVVDGVLRRAALIIAADDSVPGLRAKLGLAPQEQGPARPGLRMHFQLQASDTPPEFVEIFIGRGNEIHVTPLPEGQVLVACSCAGPAMPSNNEAHDYFWRCVAEHPVLAARLARAQPITPLCGRAPLETRVQRGWSRGAVLLEEMAETFDPVTAGGTTHALVSAEMLGAYWAEMVERHDPEKTTPSSVADQIDAALARFDEARAATFREDHQHVRAVQLMTAHPWLARCALLLWSWGGRLLAQLAALTGVRRPAVLELGSAMAAGAASNEERAPESDRFEPIGEAIGIARMPPPR